MDNIPITQVDAVLLLDDRGERIAVKYYPQHCPLAANEAAPKCPWETLDKQKAFERSLAKEVEADGVREGDSGCRVVGGHLVNYRMASDFCIFVVGPSKENELLLADVGSTVMRCLVGITGDDLQKETLFNKLDCVFLLLDDVVDGGIVMENDPNVILKRIKSRGGEGSDHVPLNQTIYNLRNNVIRSLLNS